MSNKPTIEFEIDEFTGTPTIKGKNFVGGACKAAMKPYQDALGGEQETTATAQQVTFSTATTGTQRNLRN